MSDTPSAIRRMVQDQLMTRSGEERFIMGAEMFEAAREMVNASLPPDLPEMERRRQLFQRIYGEDLPVT